MKKIFTVLLVTACIVLTSCWNWGCQLSYMDMDIDLNEESVELSVGDDFQLIADVTYNDVDYKGLEWKSENEKVATVSKTGLVSAVGKGSTKIIASAIGYSYSAECMVKVNEIPAQGMTLNKEKLELSVGEEFVLVPIFLPEHSFGKNVAWQTSDGSVAQVDKNGVVRGFSAGVATIIASINYGSIKALCEVTVINAEIPDLAHNVYTVGNLLYGDREIPFVWKNGKMFYSMTGVGDFATASDIFVDGDDVYTAGCDNGDRSDLRRDAKVWKNGKELYKLTESGNGSVNTICVYQGDVYVAGNDTKTPKVWKNGEVLYSLPHNGEWSQLWSMVVVDGVVYSAGVDITADGYILKVYKNQEVLYALNQASLITAVNAISVYNGDVYVASCCQASDFGAYVAIIWKNGEELYTFNDAENESAYVSSMFIYDGDVYAAGCEFVNGSPKIMLWKNGSELYEMENPGSVVEASSVKVVDGDVYVAGDNVFDDVPKVWKNGKLLYEFGDKNAYFSSMFVK